MTTKHDYNAVLGKIKYQASHMTEKEKREDIAPLKVTLRPSEIASIIRALKVAHAVTQEPSDAVAMACRKGWLDGLAKARGSKKSFHISMELYADKASMKAGIAKMLEGVE